METSEQQWIASDEPPPYEIVNPNGRSRAILTCDHASLRIPRRLGTLGLGPQDLERHIAWDIGAELVARRLTEILDAPLAVAGYSRLVVDCNRPLTVPEAFVTRSEDTDVPGNMGMSTQEQAERAEAFFWPYQDAIHKLVIAHLKRCVPVMIFVHSFTPVFRGVQRPWDIGVLWRLDDRLSRLVLEELRLDTTLVVGEKSDPYPCALNEDYGALVHAERRGMPYVVFEIRQDLIGSEEGATIWAERLGSILSEAIKHPSVADFGEPATDVHEPRYT